MPDHSALEQKIAVVFTKTGPAVYHSHHDMIRFWERAVKRAGLPMRLTQGFNPRPRIIFPHALGVGILSRHEETELELYRRLPLDDVRERVIRACGGTLEVTEVRNLPPVKKSRQLTASSYRISGWPEEAAARLPAAAAGIMAQTEIVMERGAPGDRRRVDIRPCLASLVCEDGALLLELRHSQTGSARPDEAAKLAAAACGTDWRDLLLEKTAMTLV